MGGTPGDIDNDTALRSVIAGLERLTKLF